MPMSGRASQLSALVAVHVIRLQNEGNALVGKRVAAVLLHSLGRLRGARLQKGGKKEE
jgi:hypothetical protein